MLRIALSVLSIIIAFGAYVPYIFDILSGKARPARSARLMFTVLLLVALLQQHALGSGWALAVTIGEAIGSVMILVLALQKGVGGLKRTDLICYVLLGLGMLVWLTTRNAVLGLHLTVLTDVVAFMPTLIKTWREPDSETPLFFIAGAVAPLFSMAAAGEYTYAVLLFPAYLAAVNLIEVGLIYRHKLTL
jgi:Na+/phosphate symporter